MGAASQALRGVPPERLHLALSGRARWRGRRGISFSSVEPLGILLLIITDERVAPFSVSLLANCVTVAICMLCAHGGSEHGAWHKTTNV